MVNIIMPVFFLLKGNGKKGNVLKSIPYEKKFLKLRVG